MLKLIRFSLSLKLLHLDTNPLFSMIPHTLEIIGQATFKQGKQLFQLPYEAGL